MTATFSGIPAHQYKRRYLVLGYQTVYNCRYIGGHEHTVVSRCSQLKWTPVYVKGAMRAEKCSRHAPDPCTSVINSLKHVKPIAPMFHLDVKDIHSFSIGSRRMTSGGCKSMKSIGIMCTCLFIVESVSASDRPYFCSSKLTYHCQS